MRCICRCLPGFNEVMQSLCWAIFGISLFFFLLTSDRQVSQLAWNRGILQGAETALTPRHLQVTVPSEQGGNGGHTRRSLLDAVQRNVMRRRPSTPRRWIIDERLYAYLATRSELAASTDNNIAPSGPLQLQPTRVRRRGRDVSREPLIQDNSLPEASHP